MIKSTTTPLTVMHKALKTMMIKSLHEMNASEPNKADRDDSTVKTEATELSTTTTAAATPQKRVTFVPFVTARQTIARSDYSPDELKRCWYDSEEYSTITRKCSSQIAKLNRGEKLYDKKYCSRGLECHTKKRSLERQLNRERALCAVLDEQDAQDYEGNCEAIAEVYRLAAGKCQSWAHMVALFDERAVQKIMKQEASLTL